MVACPFRNKTQLTNQEIKDGERDQEYDAFIHLFVRNDPVVFIFYVLANNEDDLRCPIEKAPKRATQQSLIAVMQFGQKKRNYTACVMQGIIAGR